jgi:hypothetical protein
MTVDVGGVAEYNSISSKYTGTNEYRKSSTKLNRCGDNNLKNRILRSQVRTINGMYNNQSLNIRMHP